MNERRRSRHSTHRHSGESSHRSSHLLSDGSAHGASRDERAQGAPLDRTLGAGVICVVLFTALAHGTVEPWSIAVFELAVAVLIALWSVGTIAAKRISLRVPAVFFPLAGLVALVAVQSVSYTGNGGNRISLSMDVEATRSSLLVLSCIVVLVPLAGGFLADKDRLKTLARVLAIYGFALALFALLQHLSWNGRFYWVRPNTQGSSPFGPFVNHNNFSGYIELLIPIPLALALTGAVKGETRLFYGFAAALMSIACVASLSRGGMISLTASVLFLFVMKRRLRGLDEDEEPGTGVLALLWRFAAPVTIAAAIVIGVIWIGSDSVVTRVVGQSQADAAASGTVTKETFGSSRGWLWRDTLKMIEARPIFGVGFGAYGTAYPIYSRSDGSFLVDRAHNDYLQILSDCGIIGGLLAIWFIVVVWRGLARAVRSHDRFLAAMSLGCGASVFALLVHSVFDFNLQLPANALLFLLLSAIPVMVSSHMVKSRVKARVVLHRAEMTAPVPLLALEAAPENLQQQLPGTN